MAEPDFIVVGSGCGGVTAAQAFTEAGASVLMIDAGAEPELGQTQPPNKSFLDLRRHDKQQYRYLLGSNLESLSWGEVGKGEQITPPRRHILSLVDKLLPVSSTSFSAFESLARGGLGVGWGLGCWEFSPDELKAAGLNPALMADAYNEVAERIGISATNDEAADYTIGNLTKYQPSVRMDNNHRLIYKKYLAKVNRLRRQGFVMGRAPLALLTKDFNGRQAYKYDGLDYYANHGQSAWRPSVTLERLAKFPNFKYLSGQLAIRFSERANSTEIVCLDIKSNKLHSFKSKRLILAPGALGSARIVLRSLPKRNVRLPLLSNPYSYLPCVQPAMVGKAAEAKKIGFSQLSLFLDEQQNNFGASMASIYSYQSLMLFRLIRQTPLNFVDGRALMQYLSSGLVIMGVHQPDRAGATKYLQLQESVSSPTGDRLKIAYKSSTKETAERNRREKKYVTAMRSLGVFALKRIQPADGAGIHYAGTVPFSKRQQDFRLHTSGRLHGTRNVYLADSSGFNFLPAKGLTFSLMANARLTARGALAHE